MCVMVCNLVFLAMVIVSDSCLLLRLFLPLGFLIPMLIWGYVPNLVVTYYTVLGWYSLKTCSFSEQKLRRSRSWKEWGVISINDNVLYYNCHLQNVIFLHIWNKCTGYHIKIYFHKISINFYLIIIDMMNAFLFSF